MATRAHRFRQIFGELRRAVGNALAAADVLRLAGLILGKSKTEIKKEEARELKALEPAPVSLIEHAPLDKAFADGGYKVSRAERAALEWG